MKFNNQISSIYIVSDTNTRKACITLDLLYICMYTVKWSHTHSVLWRWPKLTTLWIVWVLCLPAVHYNTQIYGENPGAKVSDWKINERCVWKSLFFIEYKLFKYIFFLFMIKIFIVIICSKYVVPFYKNLKYLKVAE